MPRWIFLGSLDILEHQTPEAVDLNKAVIWMNGGEEN